MLAVMYHYVHPLNNAFIRGLKALDLDDFIVQLDYLNENFTIIGPGDFLEVCGKRRAPRKDFALLTFDDGYSDMYHYVLPELLKRNLKAFFYVPDYFGKRELLDVNAIHVLLTREELVPRYLLAIKEYVDDHCDTGFDEYLARVTYHSRYDSREVQVIKQMLQFLLPHNHRKALIRQMVESFSGYDMASLFENYYCSKKQLNELIAEGMHIGGHGVDHVWLNTLPVNEQETEIKSSMEFLRSLDHQEFYSFCYPFGGYNQDTLNLVESNGFSFAFTTKPQRIDLANNSVFEIPRMDTNDIYPKAPAFKTFSNQSL